MQLLLRLCAIVALVLSVVQGTPLFWPLRISRVAVVLTRSTTSAALCDKEQMKDVVFNNSRSMRALVARESSASDQLSGNVFGPFMLSRDAALGPNACNVVGFATAAQDAAMRAGVRLRLA